MSTPISIEPTAAQLIDALNGTFGKHAGNRASHAKGHCAMGHFEPSDELRRLTSARIFAKPRLSARVRLSIGGGNPKVSDKSRTVRGLAMRLSDGDETYDLVAISEPVFFAATPESFVSFLQARVPDAATKKPDPDKLAAHNARFPDGKAQPALLAAHPAPASYATTPYYSTHAFRFVDAAGQSTWARLVMEPVAGTHYLDSQAEADLPDEFLEAEFTQRLTAAPVEFVLQAMLPGPADSLTDPTQQWAGNGSRIPLGTLRINELAPGECDAIIFVPTQLPKGIEPSDDPVLKARAAAYAVSMGRRQP